MSAATEQLTIAMRIAEACASVEIAQRSMRGRNFAGAGNITASLQDVVEVLREQAVDVFNAVIDAKCDELSAEADR